jgi:Flp pilus assembly protein TadD
MDEETDLPEPRPRAFVAACGYLELGLADLALEELEELGEMGRRDAAVRELRVAARIQMKQWEEAIEEGHALCRDEPECAAAWLHTAYALHEAGRTRDACALLLSAHDVVRRDPLYHYNMACYLAVLGDPQNAEVSLRVAFAARPALRRYAKGDPDLKTLGPFEDW